MTDEPENHTIRLLQEMRAENAAFRQEFVAFRQDVNARFEVMAADIGKVHAEVLATKSIMLDVVVKLTSLEKRVQKLEDA